MAVVVEMPVGMPPSFTVRPETYLCQISPRKPRVIHQLNQSRGQELVTSSVLMGCIISVLPFDLFGWEREATGWFMIESYTVVTHVPSLT